MSLPRLSGLGWWLPSCHLFQGHICSSRAKAWPVINTLLSVPFESCPCLLPGWGVQQGH